MELLDSYIISKELCSNLQGGGDMRNIAFIFHYSEPSLQRQRLFQKCCHYNGFAVVKNP